MRGFRLLPLLLLASACREEEPPTTLHFQVTRPAAEKVRLAVMADASTPGGSAPARAKPEPAPRPSPPAAAEMPRTGGGAATTGECKRAADCVVEPADCCDCANGGKQHAITRARAAASRAARAKRCRDVMCTMMYSTDPSCGKRAGCVDHRCVLISADSR